MQDEDEPVVVVHHPGLGQLFFVSHNLVAVILEPGGIPYEAIQCMNVELHSYLSAFLGKFIQLISR